jgi:hypothetical protein
LKINIYNTIIISIKPTQNKHHTPMEQLFALNVFSQRRLRIELTKVVSETRSGFSFDEKTIGSILELERCPTLTAFWHNLLNYIIIDVSFETNSSNPNINMRYKKDDIDISVRASTKDCITLQVFYQDTRFSDLKNLDYNICIEIARIIRHLSDLIIILVPDTNSDPNIPICSVLSCT